MAPIPANFQNLFTNPQLTQRTPNVPIVKKGSIISFYYIGQTKRQIHDPYPLIIVSDMFTEMIRGVNLHYLTLPYVRNMVTTYAQKDFSYKYIKGDSYIVSAFRSYKRSGISQVRMLDVAFLKNLLSVVRALDVGEIDQMRQQIQNMMQQAPQQPKAVAGEEIR